jgi:hypothetical protein
MPLQGEGLSPLLGSCGVRKRKVIGGEGNSRLGEGEERQAEAKRRQGDRGGVMEVREESEAAGAGLCGGKGRVGGRGMKNRKEREMKEG